MKKHNFYPGPSILSEYTIQNTAEGVKELAGEQLSVMEISHRSNAFKNIIEEAEQLFKELLNVPDGYSVLFLHGGASMQFCMIPYNLLNKKAAYLNTGSWSAKAIKEAKLFGEVVEVASSKESNYNYIPKGYTIPSDADYFHITTNNTIYGTEIKEDITSEIPLVADTSSDIFSRPIDVSKYALIYGGAQKNLGPAGLGFAIIRNDILGKVDRPIPTMLDYKTHVDKASTFNTPPAVAIFASLQTLKWYKQMGGIEKMHQTNNEKADLLYKEIDRNKLFKGTAEKEDRSIMNVTFVLNDDYKELEKEFLDYTLANNIVGVKGHRSVGGYRASIYNALPVDSVNHLISVMQKFEQEKA